MKEEQWDIKININYLFSYNIGKTVRLVIITLQSFVKIYYVILNDVTAVEQTVA